MIITLGAISVLKKVDQTDPRVIAVCRVIFVVYMAISLAVQLYIRSRILAKKEGGSVTVPPKAASPFAALSEAAAPDGDAGGAKKEGEGSGGEEVDATIDATAGRRKARGVAAEAAAEPEVVTVEEYDLSVLTTVRRGLLFNALLLSVFHLKMGSLNPLVITSATGLARLLDEPLFQLHVLGRPAEDALARPFKPEANPLMAMLSGTPPDGEEAESTDAAEGAAAPTSAATGAESAAGGGGSKGAAAATTTARRRKGAAGAGATRRVPDSAGARKDL